MALKVVLKARNTRWIKLYVGLQVWCVYGRHG